MKFVIESTYWHEPEKLLKYYPFLREYGFESIERDINGRTEKVSYVYIATLEELLRLKDQCKEELVITKTLYSSEMCIEIYDGYRE